MPRLIINADDFGLTRGVNRAIGEAGRSGAITSATLMANGPAFSDAVAQAKNAPQLKTGCHVVLIDGVPLAEGIPSLVGAHGRFGASLRTFASAALRGRLAPSEIEREVEAQIRRIQAAGLTVTHLDTHKHTHIYPQVLHPMLRAARVCGIRAIRNPFESWRSWPTGLIARSPEMWLRCAAVGVLRSFRGSFERAIRAEGMRSTDGTLAVAATGQLDQKSLLAILDALPEGTWELVCHPGYVDPDLRTAGTRLVETREVELLALTSDATKTKFRERGIQLISYADL